MPHSFRARSTQRLRRSAISSWGCKKPETPHTFREWCARKLLKALDGRQFSSWGCKQPETPRSTQSLRLSATSSWGCKEPETSHNFREWCAQKVFKVRRSALSAWGCTEPETPLTCRAGGCAEPEAAGNFQHGGAQSLRRPAIFVRGVRRA